MIEYKERMDFKGLNHWNDRLRADCHAKKPVKVNEWFYSGGGYILLLSEIGWRMSIRAKKGFLLKFVDGEYESVVSIGKAITEVNKLNTMAPESEAQRKESD